MKRRATAVVAFFGISALLVLSCDGLAIGTGLRGNPDRTIIDHLDANVEGITAARIADAKKDLVIAYWHTSHGSQLVDPVRAGMNEFYTARGCPDWFVLNGENGLRIAEESPDIGAFDTNSVPHSAQLFQEAVRTYLAGHAGTNVIMASWCGQVGYDTTTAEGIDSYLQRMTELEAEYPDVAFVYMTGHSDGGGLEGQVHRYNQQIRKYCVDNHKWLYDFYDIECYDPDGTYFGDKHVNDNCDYDSDGNGSLDANWATAWQSAHPGEWWDSGAAHSQSLNGNQKAKAAWQLWCAIAETK